MNRYVCKFISGQPLFTIHAEWLSDAVKTAEKELYRELDKYGRIYNILYSTKDIDYIKSCTMTVCFGDDTCMPIIVEKMGDYE